MLYPPGIARQIKHHLLSERVDLDLDGVLRLVLHGGRVRRRSGDTFVHKERASISPPSISPPSVSPPTTKTIARDSTGRGNLSAKEPPQGFFGLRIRAWQCVHEQYTLHTIARTGSKSAADLSMHPFLRTPWVRNSNEVPLVTGLRIISYLIYSRYAKRKQLNLFKKKTYKLR